MSQVLVSWMACAAFAFVALPVLTYFTGFEGLIKYWLMPWLGYHFWMSTFTVIHHTAPHIPFKKAAEWNAAKVCWQRTDGSCVGHTCGCCRGLQTSQGPEGIGRRIQHGIQHGSMEYFPLPLAIVPKMTLLCHLSRYDASVKCLYQL